MTRTKWKVMGDPTTEFIYLDRLSNRDAIIYIANKYKDKILHENFLSSNQHYDIVAKDFGITKSDLYLFFTFRLKINDLSHKFNSWDYDAQSWLDKKENEKRIKEGKEKKSKEVFYSVFHIWKILAFYCKFYSYKKAKAVLKKMQQLHYSQIKNGWKPVIKQRLQEIFTPLFFPDENYKNRDIIMCTVDNKEKRGVYKGKLIYYGQKEDATLKFEDYYFPGCLVIPKEEERMEKIDEILEKNKTPIIIGVRDNPARNIVNTILDIKMRAL